MSYTDGISNTQLLLTTLDSTERTSEAKTHTANSASADGASIADSATSTHLSGAGTLLATAGADGVRTEKVAALKSAIDSGTYNVPGSAVADKLITHLLG